MLGNRIGIDLGTAKTVIHIPGKGTVLSEPSFAAYSTETGKMLCAGKQAYDMIGREPQNVIVCQPIVNGVVSDYAIAEQMVHHFMQKIIGNTIFKPVAMVTIPSVITEVQRRTIISVVISAGARKVCLIEAPLAAALGAGVNIKSPEGIMIVDIGSGTTNIAVVTGGCLALTHTIKTAGAEFDSAIQKYIRKRWNIQIGLKTAEEIKIQIASATQRDLVYTQAKGRDAITGLPKSVEVSSEDIRMAIADVLEALLDAIHDMFERAPADLVGDVEQTGIVLTGGGCQIYGLDYLIADATGIPTRFGHDVENCGARGTGIALKKYAFFKQYGYDFKTKEDVRVG